MFDSPKAWITGTQNTEDPRDFMKASFDRFEIDAAYRFGGAPAKIVTPVGACVIGTAAYAAGDSVTNHQSNIAALRGTKPTIVGVSDNYGGNRWRRSEVRSARSA